MAQSGIRKVYDFASVGETKEDFDSRQRNADENIIQVPIGIKVPMELSEGQSGPFKMHTNIEDVITDNFRNMLMTNFGERLGLYDFGANLRELAFELGTERFDEEAVRRIRKTTQKYMPYIQLISFEPLVDRFENEHVAKVGVRITYRVNSLSNKERRVEAVVYTAG